MPASHSSSSLPLKSDSLGLGSIKAKSPQRQRQAVKDNARPAGHAKVSLSGSPSSSKKPCRQVDSHANPQEEHSDDDRTPKKQSPTAALPQNVEDEVSRGTLVTTTTTTSDSSVTKGELSTISTDLCTESTEFSHDSLGSPSHWAKTDPKDLTDEQCQIALGNSRELQEPGVDDEQPVATAPAIRSSRSLPGPLRIIKHSSRPRSYYKRKADRIIDAHARQVYRMQAAHDDAVRKLRADHAAETQSLSSSYHGMLDQMREAFVAQGESTTLTIERLERKISDMADLVLLVQARSSSQGQLQSHSRGRSSKRRRNGEHVGGRGGSHHIEGSSPLSDVHYSPEQMQLDSPPRLEVWPSSTGISRCMAESTSYIDPKKRRKRSSLIYTSTDDQ